MRQSKAEENYSTKFTNLILLANFQNLLAGRLVRYNPSLAGRSYVVEYFCHGTIMVGSC